MDYLNPIATQIEAVFIQNTNQEAFSWDLFYLPFTMRSWVGMVVVAALVAIVIRY